MVDPLMAHLLGNLIERLKQQLHLTSIVVTHDMRFAKKLADRVVFLHEGRGAVSSGRWRRWSEQTIRFCGSSWSWTSWCCRPEETNAIRAWQKMLPRRGLRTYDEANVTNYLAAPAPIVVWLAQPSVRCEGT